MKTNLLNQDGRIEEKQASVCFTQIVGTHARFVSYTNLVINKRYVYSVYFLFANALFEAPEAQLYFF